MLPFKGFPNGKIHLTPIPAPFFTDLLPQIDDLVELKLILYALWFLDRQEGQYRYITLENFLSDQKLMEGLGVDPQTALEKGLANAVKRGVLLQAQTGAVPKSYYFLNSPRGRAAAGLVGGGKWQPEGNIPVSLAHERPNIFRLYEEHIGPLTPIMSDTLKEAEETYPPEWIEDALRLAVHKNARNWRYVDAILRSWQEKGRHETDRRNSQEDHRGYIEGDFAEFIEH
jgi:DNA replication protein